MTGISRRDLLKAGAACTMSSALLTMFGSTAYGKCRAYADAILRKGEPPRPEEGAFTLVVLPDTQHYSEDYPATFLAQTNWIAENQSIRKIAGVVHLGDITNRNSPQEWENASRALSVLDGKVPYFLTTGNHDYGAGGHCADRTTLLNSYFPVSRFQDHPSFGGVYDKEPDRIENNYHLFEAGGQKFLVLSLEFGPRHDVVRWANDVVSCHQDRAVILSTHAYTYLDNTRYDWKRSSGSQIWNPHSYGMALASSDDATDGEELWTQLVSQHENFVLTLNGHVLGDGLARLATPTRAGRDIEQLLVNFQMRPRGGDGWLRLLEFRQDGEVQVYDYSPTRRQRNESPKNQFAMSLAPIAMV